ncbi:odorant receptor Or2-like [Planococcus citri]|uniref:odorant receptor Or2-like n=1 Tax=Planococcus citri TaxID=170843 RepID=UPI0031F989BB
MNVVNDLVKIMNQIRGKENIFGYKSTIANQFYLAYCFMGGIYVSKKFHRHTKLVWFSWTLSMVLLCLFQFVSYFLYGDKKDIAALLYAVFVFVVTFFACFLVPYISVFHFDKNLHDVIQIADYIIIKHNIHKKSTELLKKLLLYIILYECLTAFIYYSSCFLSVIFFYEEEKVKNHNYYFVYAPKLDQYGSPQLFVIYNTIAALCSLSIGVSYPMISFMLIFCTVIFQNGMQQIIIDLNSLDSNNVMTVETYNIVEPKFKSAIMKCIRDFQVACKMIECFKGFYEKLAAIMLPTVLLFEITHAFIFLLPGISTAVRLQEIFIFFPTIQPVFLLCWTGEILEESVQKLSFAVYSTPWYWSTSLRKDVYIFLCQTQRPMTVTALGAYPLRLATFLRFMNVIQSSVNVLRAIISK